MSAKMGRDSLPREDFHIALEEKTVNIAWHVHKVFRLMTQIEHEHIMTAPKVGDLEYNVFAIHFRGLLRVSWLLSH